MENTQLHNVSVVVGAIAGKTVVGVNATGNEPYIAIHNAEGDLKHFVHKCSCGYEGGWEISDLLGAEFNTPVEEHFYGVRCGDVECEHENMGRYSILTGYFYTVD